MPIYTKKGDKGETGLPGKRRLPKTEQIFEVLGAFDQLNATIGFAISLDQNKEGERVTPYLYSIQSDLLHVGSYVASEKPESIKLKILNNRIKQFERAIDRWEKETGELKNFILTGGTQKAAALHMARAITRQAERNYHRLDDKNRKVSRYLNRLSDFFFQAARVVNFREGKPEQIWNKSQNSQ